MSAFLCPKCHGEGWVSKPPWVAGDIDLWTANNTGGFTCPVCHGQGYVVIAALQSGGSEG